MPSRKAPRERAGIPTRHKSWRLIKDQESQQSAWHVSRESFVGPGQTKRDGTDHSSILDLCLLEGGRSATADVQLRMCSKCTIVRQNLPRKSQQPPGDAELWQAAGAQRHRWISVTQEQGMKRANLGETDGWQKKQPGTQALDKDSEAFKLSQRTAANGSTISASVKRYL